MTTEVTQAEKRVWTSTKQRPVAERLWEKALADGTGCWIWQAALRAGYGRISVRGKDVPAHLVAYEIVKGPIPEGLEPDHLCRVRACINPAHLEPVTHQENVLRGVGASAVNARRTHCPQGHEYSEANTYHWGGRRQCRTCAAAAKRGHEQARGPRVRATSEEGAG